MRKVEMNVYTWEELTEEAKRNFWESGYFDFSDSYSSNYEKTLDAFCEALDAECWGWYVNNMTYDFSSDTIGRWMDCPEDTERAAAWIYKTIWNEYGNALYNGKYYCTPGKWIGGKYNYKSKRSNILLESVCPLTGYVADDTILRPILEVLEGKRTYTSPDDMVHDCLDGFFRDWRDDIDYCNSFEFFCEIMEANHADMEFTADGKPF